jgi:hypothetical protein
MNKATELEFLKWFYYETDFGPADGDVKYIMKKEFMEETGKQLPDNYSIEEEE